MDIQTSFSPQIAQFAPPKPVSGILADYWGVDSKSPHIVYANAGLKSTRWLQSTHIIRKYLLIHAILA